MGLKGWIPFFVLYVLAIHTVVKNGRPLELLVQHKNCFENIFYLAAHLK